MRKLVTVALILLLCIVLLAGCTKDSLAGIYASDAASYQIVLHEDGTAEYLGNEDAQWKARGNKVIISAQYPQYFLDVFLDPVVLSEAEMKAVCAKINAMENVKRTSIALNVISVTLEKEDADHKVAQQIEQIEGVASVSEVPWVPEIDFELIVKDGCLVKENATENIVFEKIGE